MEVKVITRKSCAPCHTLLRWMDVHHIKYTEYDADERPDIMDALIAKTGMQIVPMTIIGNEVIPGLNLHRIRNLVDNRTSTPV